MSLLVCFVFLGVLPYLRFKPSDLIDFSVYYGAGLKAVSHHTVYDVTDHFQFKYSPLIALIFGQSISRVGDFATSGAVYTCVNWMLWLWFLLDLFRQVALRVSLKTLDWTRQVHYLAIFSGFFGSAWLTELKFGQVNIFPLFISYVFFKHYKKNTTSSIRLWLSLLLALEFQLKPYVLLIGMYLLFQGDWKMLLATAIWGGISDFGVLTGFHGWSLALSENVAWLKTLSQSSQVLLDSGYNAGVLGVLNVWLPQAWMASVGWVVLLLGFARVLWSYKNRDPLMNFALLFGAIFLFNPLVWSYWIVFLVPAFVYCLVCYEQVAFAWSQKDRVWYWIELLPLCFFAHFHLAAYSIQLGLVGSALLVLRKMVAWDGIEPPTHAFSGRCSTD